MSVILRYYDWPDPEDMVLPEPPEDISIEEWKKDKVVMGMSCLGVFQLAWQMVGMEKLMMDRVLNPKLVEVKQRGEQVIRLD